MPVQGTGCILHEIFNFTLYDHPVTAKNNIFNV